MAYAMGMNIDTLRKKLAAVDNLTAFAARARVGIRTIRRILHEPDRTYGPTVVIMDRLADALRGRK